MTYKHKTHAVDSDGKITSNADVDFYIDEVRNTCYVNIWFFFVHLLLSPLGNSWLTTIFI